MGNGKGLIKEKGVAKAKGKARARVSPTRGTLAIVCLQKGKGQTMEFVTIGPVAMVIASTGQVVGSNMKGQKGVSKGRQMRRRCLPMEA